MPDTTIPPVHQLTMTVLMTPDMANLSGNVHGGSVLKLLDQVAYACASRYAGRYVVTRSVDQVTFLQPHPCGRTGHFPGQRELHRPHLDGGGHQGGHREHPRAGGASRQQLFLHIVALDESGRPASVPPLQLQTQVQKRRQHAAQLRRDLRKELGERFEQARVAFPDGD